MALPQGFIEQIKRHPELEVLLTSLDTDPEVSVRVNPAKPPVICPRDAERVPWCEWGYYLKERPTFTFDPAMHQGLYYVQDASSMAIAAVIRQIVGDLNSSGPVRYLDACAAPGGKTTTALSALPEGSVVVANEYDYKRAEILVENISKWGNPNVVVSRGDTSRLRSMRGAFDIVAVDAPCSGEGMMRKDQQAVDQWSPVLVEQCACTQRQILENVWEAVAPSGYLIYSTCTFNTKENEDNLRWLIETCGAKPVEITALSGNHTDMSGQGHPSSRYHAGVIPGLDIPYPCYRFVPGLVRGEGLFLAVVQKGEQGSSDSQRTSQLIATGRTHRGAKGKGAERPVNSDMVQAWFADDMHIHTVGEHIYAMPRANAAFMLDVASKLDTLLIGVEAATAKGRDIIPTHQLGLCTSLAPKAFPSVEVSYADALAYLRHESLSLPSGTPRGIVMVTYGAHPLGMVKNLGNRANNLMPKPWRILSQSTPDTPVTL